MESFAQKKKTELGLFRHSNVINSVKEAQQGQMAGQQFVNRFVEKEGRLWKLEGWKDDVLDWTVTQTARHSCKLDSDSDRMHHFLV